MVPAGQEYVTLRLRVCWASQVLDPRYPEGQAAERDTHWVSVWVVLAGQLVQAPAGAVAGSQVLVVCAQQLGYPALS